MIISIEVIAVVAMAVVGFFVGRKVGIKQIKDKERKRLKAEGNAGNKTKQEE